MGVMEEAQALARAGRQADARAHVQRASAAGDAEALLAVANWRLFGLYGPRDPGEAHRLLERAGMAGSAEAVRLRATLIGNGTGCTPDPARAAHLLRTIAGADPVAAAQLALLAKMMPPDQARGLATETLREQPPIRVVRGLLLPDECQYLIRQAEPRLEPSYIVDPHGRRRPHPVRTSAGTSFGPVHEDLVVRALNLRIAAATDTDVSWGEPLHMLRYQPGQEYRPHLDTLPGVTNQRRWTALIYLNEAFEGGETQFDRIGLTFRGRTGDALMFGSLDPHGRPDERTRHAGLPVRSGLKWLATRWVRGAAYDPWNG